MSKCLVLLHTVSSLVGLFDDLAEELLPGDVQVLHVADEMLLDVVLRKGGLSPFIYRRVASHVVAAEQAGANVVMFTCSSISPCAEVTASMVNVPVLKVDQPMVDEAVSIGSRIGVAATAPTTLGPTTGLVRERAVLAGKQVAVDALLCEGAYEALFAGDVETHDRIVRDALRQLMARNDVVVLAQASMARVADTIPREDRSVPILSSPRLAMAEARDILEQTV
jgi:aspartate/glutamate racemase